MSELRRDPLHSRAVFVAEERAGRPNAEGMLGTPSLWEQARRSIAVEHDPTCPFCPGNEHETPAETRAIRAAGTAANGPGWRARVIGNRFPAVRDDAGLHEVLICAAEHRMLAGELSQTQWTDVWRLLHVRACDYAAAGRWRWASLFQNVGAAAGASLDHAHCQLLALPDVPDAPQAEYTRAERHFSAHSECYWCGLIASERADGARVVANSENFFAVCPSAARLPFETWILPNRHNSRFDLAGEEDLVELAKLHRSISTALADLTPGLNWWIASAPFDVPASRHYHWHIEIMPRVTTMAGFEWSSGWFINTVSPERAAGVLRERLRSLE